MCCWNSRRHKKNILHFFFFTVVYKNGDIMACLWLMTFPALQNLQIYSYTMLRNKRDSTLVSHTYRTCKYLIQGHSKKQQQSRDLHTDFSSSRLSNMLTKAFTVFSVSASETAAKQGKLKQNIFPVSPEVRNLQKVTEFALTI